MRVVVGRVEPHLPALARGSTCRHEARVGGRQQVKISLQVAMGRWILEQRAGSEESCCGMGIRRADHQDIRAQLVAVFFLAPFLE